MANDNVIRIDDFRDHTARPTGFKQSVRVTQGPGELRETGQREEARYVPPKKLYPLGETITPNVQVVLRLLEEAGINTTDGLNAVDEDDQVSAEIAMQHLKALMPELFCNRNVGDAFGSIISSVFHAIQNHGSVEFDRPKIEAIRFALRKLIDDPFLPYDDAMKLIDGLEKAGFTVEPSKFGVLAEVLDGQSLR